MSGAGGADACGVSGAFRDAAEGCAATGKKGKRSGRPSPVSVRFSAAERAWLAAEAGRLPLGTYIRAKALAGYETAGDRAGTAGSLRKQSRRRVVKPDADTVLLGRVLAALGRSRLAASLNALATAAERGRLQDADDVGPALRRACADVGAMRAALCGALGLRDGRGGREGRP